MLKLAMDELNFSSVTDLERNNFIITNGFELSFRRQK